jgi:hypothetical protein
MRSVVLVALAAVGTGCVAGGHGHVRGGVLVYSDPPPRRVVVVESNPGYVWIDGQWVWAGNQWVWYDGYWERERPGYVYVAGYWQRSGSGHVWVAPRWRHHSGHSVVLRRPVDTHVRVRARPAGQGHIKVHGGGQGHIKVHGGGQGRVKVRARPGR